MEFENLKNYEYLITMLGKEIKKEVKDHKTIRKLYHRCEMLEKICLSEAESLPSRYKADYLSHLGKLQQDFVITVNEYNATLIRKE